MLAVTVSSKAQLLNREITLAPNRQSVEDLLELISNQGNFYFSYNSSILRRDSIVSYPGGTRTVRAALNLIFPSGYEFRESENYIIIRRTPIRIQLITNEQPAGENNYFVTGVVRDDQTGERIAAASIYEKERLAATLTDESGAFRLRLKSRYSNASLTVSKEFYEDTTVRIRSGYNQAVTITLSPVEFSGADVIVAPGIGTVPDSLFIAVPQPDSSSILYIYKKMDSLKVQRTALGKFLLSSRLKAQSINLSKFFTVRPVQVSLTPGLSSNGKLNAQVVNNFSFNVFGGYSGGVKGFELGGLFNMDKKDVQYVQVGGLFNIVGGNMTGVQIGGLSNTVLGSGDGLQIGGLNNFTAKSVRGVQVSGISNYTGRSLTGMQLGGVTNFVRDTLKGAQIGGVINFARKLKGVQIGLINVADTSEGYSIGLINIVLKGYHKLAFYNNEVTPFNAAFKTGNHKLYSILLGGVHPDTTKRIVTFGYGVGTDLSFGKTFGMMAEFSAQYCYLGTWDYLNLLNRASVQLRVRISKWLEVYAGPAFSVMISDQPAAVKGWQYPIPSGSFKTYDLGENRTGWLGWHAGFQLF
ncbi:hypothetical protein FPE01S_02_05380 [Flavihumibacter petaseus NBRC 106054]|uniref:Uncharacterized protein n=1 Tax=Flavihumibacter petaseus NBRC 106054 TaxID=1220578 RepID=A0A0E9N122_9BACT|nr:hypothetical protein FPE01S_02_05380 [Flavihumibacter petaseus NBRC 106054]